MAKKKQPKAVETLIHDEAKRTNIPTAEYQSMLKKDEQSPIRLAYERRNRDLDPQLVWRGKEEQDRSDLVVQAPPLYIQEKVHPKVLIDDLVHRTKLDDKAADLQIDLFADFNGLPDDTARTEFYKHNANWTNRMILGDSLQVMASLAEREGLRGKVQCIYLDPPYGIKFNSNFQWSTTSRDVKDGKAEHITREPEQVKAFRDTWRDGIHSYLTYLRDRLTVARDLLSDSGSIFVQIGDENVHRVRALMDEVFGEENCIAIIKFRKTSSLGGSFLDDPYDYLIWFSKKRRECKFRRLFLEKQEEGLGGGQYKQLMDDKGFFKSVKSASFEYTRLFRYDNLTSQSSSKTTLFDFSINGKYFTEPKKGGWKTNIIGMKRLAKAHRLLDVGRTLSYIRFFNDFKIMPIDAAWNDTVISGFADPKIYVVETIPKAIQRCILMTTDPGDLVLDPTCGSGTSAYVAEQWGRRWITIDTSRVALALARARIMGARYPYYLLADSPEGQLKEAEAAGKALSSAPTYHDLRHGFVYERVPHITLKSIANNAEIDVIWEKYQETLEPLRESLNAALGEKWEEWEIPREAVEGWPEDAKKAHGEWWQNRIARQKEIDASIGGKADYEYLYDKPYDDKGVVRVAGPFTVESLSPHRILGIDENDELIEQASDKEPLYGRQQDFASMILENLKMAGVQQAHKEDRISFVSLTPWPGDMICAEGRYREGSEDAYKERRAGVLIGPEFGTVSRPDLVEAAREAADADFDVLVACAFNYEAHTAEFNKLGRVPVLKARMNADLHMAEDLKNTGKGNLFVIFGEPDIEIFDDRDGQIRVKVHGVDVFHPNTGEVRSDGPEGIACWFIDTDYNEESFFVRHAYFLGANDPYKSLKTSLKAEVNREAWETLHSDISRPFKKPESGRIAVKVINHLGDEVMKVFRVE
jgi:adenine-specific DNA-methyltransferase